MENGKWKTTGLALLLLAIGCYLLPGAAQAQTRSVTANVAWSAGSVTGHTTWKVYHCVGVNCAPSQEIATVPAAQLIYSHAITNDPGQTTYGYAVKGVNNDGMTALGPVGYGVTPAVSNPPAGTPGAVTITIVVQP